MMIFLLLLVLGLVVVLLVLYYLLTRNYDFWENQNIPFISPQFPFGNLKQVALQKIYIGELLKNLYDEHADKKYVGIFAFHRPALLVRDPELVRRILVKDSTKFINRILELDESLDPLNARTLFALKDEKWHNMRVHLSPVFTSAKMRFMFQLVQRNAQDLIRYLNKETAQHGPSVEVLEAMTRFTTDVVSSCAFGIDSKSLTDEAAEFSKRLSTIFDFNFLQAIANLATFFAPALPKIFRIKVLGAEVEDFLRTTVWDTINFREKNGVERKDFLETLMELRSKGQDFDGDNLVAQAFAFYLAGTETSTLTLAYALHELSLHPDIQSRLREHVRQVLHNRKEVTYEEVRDMKYLDRVVLETLRKHTIVPFVERRCNTDYAISSPRGDGTRIIPKGTGVYIPVMGLHHDPEFHPEPEKFHPDRFLKDIQPYTYIPFGEGPRNCAGMRFALMQVKLALIQVLLYFEVAPSSATPKMIKLDKKTFLARPEGNIHLSFKQIRT